MLFERIVLTSAETAGTPGKKKKVERIAALLALAAADERATAAQYLSGDVGRKLGIGYATVAELRGQVAPAATASLTIVEVADVRKLQVQSAAGHGLIDPSTVVRIVHARGDVVKEI